jgi:hypothetical protein
MVVGRLVRRRSDEMDGSRTGSSQEPNLYWSPYEIIGFRVWTIDDNRLHGVQVPWREVSMEARCLSTGSRFGVPHSDGRCGDVGCGIYVSKTFDDLHPVDIRSYRRGYAIGIVSIGGRVVEHDAGYRAQRATILALSAGKANRHIRIAQVSAIERLLQDPEAAITEYSVATDSQDDPLRRGREFLESQYRGRQRWISGDNSASSSSNRKTS